MGAATMSNNVCLPTRSIGGYTGDLIGARASCRVPVPRSLVNASNYPWIHGCSSFGPSFRSNIPPPQSMEYWNYTGANTSLNKESGLLGAELSYQTPCHNSMYAAFHYSSNAYPLSGYPENDLIGAQISNHTAHPNYPTYVGVQPINTRPVPTVGWASRVRNEFSERDLLGAQMSNHTVCPNYPTYVGVQPINAHPVPMEGWASRIRNELSKRDRLEAEMSDHTAHPNYPIYVGVQPINAHPVSTVGWASRVRNQVGSS